MKYLFSIYIFCFFQSDLNAQSMKNEIGVNVQTSMIYLNKTSSNIFGQPSSTDFTLKKKSEFGFSIIYKRESRLSNLFFSISYFRNFQKFSGQIQNVYFPDIKKTINYKSIVNSVNWGLQKQFPIYKKNFFSLEAGTLLRYYDQKKSSIIRKEKASLTYENGDLFYNMDIDRVNNHGVIGLYANASAKFQVKQKVYVWLGLSWATPEIITYNSSILSIKVLSSYLSQGQYRISKFENLKTNQLNLFFGISHKF